MATPRSLSYLNGLWLTGYVPEQDDYEDLFASSPNIVTYNLLVGNEQGITAVSPSDPSTAYQLTKLYNTVESATDFDSGVKLPAALAGRQVLINNISGVDFELYTTGTDAYANYNSDVVMEFQPNAYLCFTCYADGYWWITSLPFFYQTTITIKGFISQSGTSAPTITYLINETGITPTLSRFATGVYRLTVTGLFVTNKTFYSINNNGALANVITLRNNSVNYMEFLTGSNATTAADGLLSHTPFEITVYPSV